MNLRDDIFVVRESISWDASSFFDDDAVSPFSMSMESVLRVVAREFLRLRVWGLGRSIEVRLSIPVCTMKKS
jgi:hypothetical protein